MDPYEKQWAKLPCSNVKFLEYFPRVEEVNFKLDFAASRFARKLVPDLRICDHAYTTLNIRELDDLEALDEQQARIKKRALAYEVHSDDAFTSVHGHSVDLAKLVIGDTIHETCVKVQLQPNNTEEDAMRPHYVLKTANKEEDIRSMLKELLLLSTMPCHKNIMGRPAFIVTASLRDADGSDGSSELADKEWMNEVVIGFMMRYIPSGSMSNNLMKRIRPSSGLPGTLPSSVKVSWALQLVSGVTFLHRTAGISHSGIKPDNILIDDPGHCHPDGGQLILIDFEQIGTWRMFRPPEIDGARILWYKIEESTAWSEAVDVYAVGSLIWLIFEDVAETVRSDTKRPEFLKTPKCLRPILMKCVDRMDKRPNLEELMDVLLEMKESLYKYD